MPHTRDHDSIVDNSPMAETETMTQQSGYRPASGMDAPDQRTADKIKQRAVEQADAVVDRAAEGAHTAAEKLRMRSDSTNGIAAKAETKAADTIDRASDYLREHDSQEMFGALREYARKHPVQAAAGALLGAFFIGKFFG